MLMNDVKDILGLEPPGEPDTQTPKPKTKRIVRKKRHRDALDPKTNLEIVTNHLEESRKRFGTKPVRKWTMEEFGNSARIDTLKLSHWKRVGSKTINSPFAFLNKKEPIPTYVEDKYKLVESNDWSREETDAMLQVASDYYLNWAVVADRFEFEGRTRTINEIKARYLEIEDSMNILNGSTEVLVNFNLEEENQRKKKLDLWLSRSREDIEKDEEALKEIEKLRRTILEEDQKQNEETCATSDVKLSSEDIMNFALTSQPLTRAPPTSGAFFGSEIAEIAHDSNLLIMPLIHRVKSYIETRSIAVRKRPLNYSKENVENIIALQSRLHQISELKGCLTAFTQRREKLSTALKERGIQVPALPSKLTPAHFCEPRKGVTSDIIGSLYSLIPPTKPIPNCTKVNGDGELARIPRFRIVYPKDIYRPELKTEVVANSTRLKSPEITETQSGSAAATENPASIRRSGRRSTRG